MVKDKAYYDALTEQVIGCAYNVANQLGYGFLEKVYENSLRIELQNSGIQVEQQCPIQVRYAGEVVGDFIADLVVEDELIVELKVAKSLDDVHLAQCLNYLKATGKHLGLLVNFGGNKVQIKRVVHNF
jgi:GxxExxY protein